MQAHLKARSWRPSWLERNIAQTVELEVVRGDSATVTAPSSGTYTLTRPDGTVAVAAQAVTVSASVATYSVTPAASEDYAVGWMETWALVVAGTTYNVKRLAAVVPQRLWCPVTTADILELHPEWTAYPPGASSWEGAIAQAWRRFEWELYHKMGKLPPLLLDSSAAYPVVLDYALANVARSLSTFAGAPEVMERLAATYDERAKGRWADIQLAYDADMDGELDAEEVRQSPGGIVFLSDTPRWRGDV